jgi:hypothetical protein
MGNRSPGYPSFWGAPPGSLRPYLVNIFDLLYISTILPAHLKSMAAKVRNKIQNKIPSAVRRQPRSTPPNAPSSG